MDKSSEKKSLMSTQDIVKAGCEKYYPGQDWKRIYAMIYMAIQSNKFRMLREGNTLFLYQIDGNVAKNCYLFTTDDAKTVIKSFINGVEGLKNAGFKKINTTLLDPQIIRLARLAKLNVQNKLINGIQHLEVTL